MSAAAAAPAAAPRAVCVTGASGFLGGWTVYHCLAQGWTVHATTRSPAKHEARMRQTLVPPGVDGAARLKVFACDLLAGKDAFRDAFAGCDVVLHTASPFFVKGATEENVVKPAVQGTRNVLEAVVAAGIDRVVLTSSTAAIYGWYGMHPVEHVMTEADWSDEAALVRANNWYCVSKTRAERLAWDMSRDGTAFKLATMNPCLILGTMLQPTLNTSSGAVLSYLSGERDDIQNCTKCIVDVSDVAMAHVLAAKRPAYDEDVWGKRYLLVGGCPSWTTIAGHLREWAGEQVGRFAEILQARVPTRTSTTVGAPALGANPPNATPFDCSRATRILGLQFTDTREMVRKTANSLKEWGLIELPAAPEEDGEAKQVEVSLNSAQ